MAFDDPWGEPDPEPAVVELRPGMTDAEVTDAVFTALFPPDEPAFASWHRSGPIVHDAETCECAVCTSMRGHYGACADCGAPLLQSEALITARTHGRGICQRCRDEQDERSEEQ